MAARPGVVEGPDPDRLPEHDLLRERCLRDRAGSPGLLRARRVEADHRRGRAARRHPRRPEPLQPRHRSEGGSPAAARGAPGDGRPEGHHLQRVPQGEQDAATEAGGHPSAGRSRAGAVLRRLRQAAARRPVRDAQGVRRRARREDDDRSRSATARAERDLEVVARPEHADRGTRRARPAERPRARDGRRPELSGRASSTSRCRASASRARPSSRSCSPPRSTRGSPPPPHSSRSR